MDEKIQQKNWTTRQAPQRETDITDITDKTDRTDKIQMRIREEEQNLFRNAHKERYGLERRKVILVALGICLVVAYVLSFLLPNALFLNNNDLSLAWYLAQIQQKIALLGKLLSGGLVTATQLTVYQSLIIAMVGGALAISGTVYQGAFRNALASPSTLGVEVGGVLGGSIYVLFFLQIDDSVHRVSEHVADTLFEKYALSFSIFLGCFAVVGFILLVTKVMGRGKMSAIMLVIAGAVVSGGIGEILNMVQYRMQLQDAFDNKVYLLRFMMMGTFGRVFTAEHLLMIGTPLLLGICLVCFMGSKLNLLVFGEDEARSMGVHVNLYRYGMVGIVTLLTAVVISFCGLIGFMGFIVPHMARKLIGADFRYLLPASALLGGICMLVIFHIAMVIEIADNINVMTSMVGGFIFLILLIKFRRKRNGDWV